MENYIPSTEYLCNNEYKNHKVINKKEYNTEQFKYKISKHITNEKINPRYSINYFTLSSMYGTIGWLSGIVVLKTESSYLDIITIEINGVIVSRIDIQLLIKLYGCDIDDNFMYIQIPKRVLINAFTIKHFNGLLLNNPIKIYVFASKLINYSTVINYTKLINYQMDKLSVDILTLDKYNIDKTKFEELNKNERMISVCLDCFKEYSKNKSSTLIHTLVIDRISKYNILPNSILKMIVEYAQYFDLKIIIYDNNLNYYLTDIKKLEFYNNSVVITDHNKIISQYKIQEETSVEDDVVALCKPKEKTISKPVCNLL